MRAPIESDVERKACAKVLDELGVFGLKLMSPGTNGMPDRIFLVPGGRAFMIEFKKPGESPKPLQAHTHEMLRKLGYDVQTHDTVEGAFNAVKDALCRATSKC